MGICYQLQKICNTMNMDVEVYALTYMIKKVVSPKCFLGSTFCYLHSESEFSTCSFP
jgi:hypothetical protein